MPGGCDHSCDGRMGGSLCAFLQAAYPSLIYFLQSAELSADEVMNSLCADSLSIVRTERERGREREREREYAACVRLD